MIKQNTIRILLVAFIFSLGFLAKQAYAAPNLTNAFDASTAGVPFNNVVSKTNYDKTANDPFLIVSKVVVTIFSILGILFIFLMVFGGYLWMTAGGNETQLTKAKGLMQDAVIGLIIMASAYAISYFITSVLVSPFTPNVGSQKAQEKQTPTAPQPASSPTTYQF